MLERISAPVLEWADGFGLLGLAIVSASEAAIQPVPPDLLVIPLALDSESYFGLFAIFFVATLSSVLGSLGGYAIGMYGGRPLIDRLAKPSTRRKIEELTSRYGDAGVFIAAVSPIPYKVLAWIAGAGRMDIRTFLLAGLFGRSIRFGLEVLVLGFWGEEFIQMLEDPVFWVAAGVLSIAAFVPISSWWKGLDNPGELQYEQN
ncbi:MAG: hypothetical protein CMA88_01985 [Euryarchaeota archaeon]|nr:hypothetical protein [Euryarchaeota archaeon]|tara:strand:+ start:1105 stop:1713 length:609 start_codon:yes stop_codon:yes gene_type:complete